nr:ABC transporter substrate-binding protein [Polaromonas sp. AET17H-212]
MAADIVISQLAPLTGVLASTGKQMVLGGQIYFSHINDTGGVHGQKIRVLVSDDGYKVEETVRLTREALANPAVVAPYTGGEPLRSPFNPWIFHVRAGYADETEHMVQQVTTLGMTRIAVMYQDDGFGKAGLEGVQKALAKRKLTLSVAAPYERNTDKVDEAVRQVKASDAQAVIMISVNKSTSAFIKRYREAGGGAQLYNISVVDPAEIVKLAGLKNAHGLGVSQMVPYPFMPSLPVVREYQALLKKYAPNELVNYTSFEQFLGAKVLVEGLRRAGPKSTRAKVMKALESMGHFDLGGTSVGYSAENRVGSRYVEVTVIGSSGKLLK